MKQRLSQECTVQSNHVRDEWQVPWLCSEKLAFMQAFRRLFDTVAVVGTENRRT
jgi:hypothetical protein